MTAFETLFGYLGIDIYRQNAPLIAGGVFAALAICALICVLMGIAYYSSISALLLFAKPIEKKEDVKRTPSNLINRCVVEYMACGENGAPLFPIDAIVMKNLNRMNLLGISFKSLENMRKSLEIAALAIAASASVSTGEAGWLVFAGGLYLIYRLACLYFDSEALKDKLFFGITTYINRELGKFYIADDKAGLRIFKNEVHSSLMEQASILQNAVNNMTRELSGAIKTSYEKLYATLYEDIKKYDNIGEKLVKPIDGLAEIFVKIERASNSLDTASRELAENISLLDGRFGTITGALEKNSAANSKSLENSEILFRELRDSLKSFNAAYFSLEEELAAVKSIQSVLSVSLQGYELSLQQTAGRFGDAVGSIVELRGKEAAELLNEAIAKHIVNFTSDTEALIEKMSDIFEQAYQQNKSEMQTLLRIEESIKNRENSQA